MATKNRTLLPDCRVEEDMAVLNRLLIATSEQSAIIERIIRECDVDHYRQHLIRTKQREIGCLLAGMLGWTMPEKNKE